MRRPLGVVILSQYFHPEVGATQTRARELARAFTRAGHRVTVIGEFPNHPHGVIPASYRGKLYEWDALDGFRVLRVRVAASPVKSFRTRLAFYASYAFMAALAGCKRLGRVDLVLATSPPLPVAAAGLALADLRRAPFVMDVRDLWPDAAVALGELSRPWMIRAAARLERRLYRRALLVTAVTRGFVEAIAAKGIDRAKLHWAPNGTLPELFAPERGDAGLRARLGLEGRFLVTFAGLFGIAQGMDFLLDLAASYRDDPGIAFLFLGDGPLRARMAARASEERLDNVVLHPQVPPEEAAPFLNASDLLLVPLRDDPVFATFVPSKLFDFLACRPPVLLAVPGEAEAILRESGGGVAARPEDLASFRSTIEAVRADPAAAARMGEAGRRFAVSRFARPRIMDELVDAVEARLAAR
ncbi:MAG: glycosyltransferase family 4 protein [Candidatus Krumholzibacteriota bacterium]|nr:glycosyltransferase family 4 protein [Candidatus Krumholzibacteriota bacterium]